MVIRRRMTTGEIGRAGSSDARPTAAAVPFSRAPPDVLPLLTLLPLYLLSELGLTWTTELTVVTLMRSSSVLSRLL
jgi:hypothetical protein